MIDIEVPKAIVDGEQNPDFSAHPEYVGSDWYLLEDRGETVVVRITKTVQG